MAEFRYPERFLGVDEETSKRETSATWVLPIPFEMTTTYAGGTKLGPRAIIEASNQLELYDIEMESEAAFAYGVHTLPFFHPTLDSLEAVSQSISDAVTSLNIQDQLLVALGGEHGITPGLVRAFAAKYPGLMVVQIDAHSDLRDEYDGTPWSHACVARRWLPYAPTVQFGIRSTCPEEVEFIRQSDRVTVFRAAEMHVDREHRYLDALKKLIDGRDVYLTIDVDGFDPSVFSATGTPEPGGIGWYDGLELIRTVTEHSRVVAVDCVELAPANASQASNYAAAKLVYKTINYVMRSRGKV